MGTQVTEKRVFAASPRVIARLEADKEAGLSPAEIMLGVMNPRRHQPAKPESIGLLMAVMSTMRVDEAVERESSEFKSLSQLERFEKRYGSVDKRRAQKARMQVRQAELDPLFRKVNRKVNKKQGKKN